MFEEHLEALQVSVACYRSTLSEPSRRQFFKRKHIFLNNNYLIYSEYHVRYSLEF